MISSVDLAHYGVSCAKHEVSVDYGTIYDKMSVDVIGLQSENSVFEYS